MQSFGTIFLWALAACTLWKGSLATSLRGGYIFQLDDPSPKSICVPELRSLLNDVVQAQNQGNTNTRKSDNEIKSKLETLEVKIGEVQANLPQEVHAKLEGQLQGVGNKLEGHLQEVQIKVEAKLEKSLHEVKTKLEGQLQGVENELEGHLQEMQTKLEAKLDESLLAVQKIIENQLQTLVEQLQLVQNKIDAVEVKSQLQEKSNKTAAPQEANQVGVPASSTMTIPSGFDLIGTRYFRIVNENAKWDTAERKCRELGGYLASVRNAEEFNAIIPKLIISYRYWLGINDHGNEGHFVSGASHKPAPFLKWGEGEPSDKNHKWNCVNTHDGHMWDYNCNNEIYFICQADNET